jgi:tetratricopeptide (TPR) repeat protein
MLHASRCIRRALLLLFATGCGMTGGSDDTAPTAPPAAALQDARQVPAPGDEAWLQTLKEDLARIGQGQEPRAVPPPPPVTVAGTPGVTETPAAAKPTPTPAEKPPALTPPAEVQPPQPKPPAPAQDAAIPPVAPPRAAPGGQPVITGQDLAAILAQSRQYATLSDQRTSTLVSAFVEEGLAALDRGDMQAAHQHFANAYELDPDDPSARDLYQRTRMLQGESVAGMAAVVGDAGETMRARADQTRTMVAHHRAQGDQAMAVGDPDLALRHYEDALTLLRTSPGAQGGSGEELEMAQRAAVARRAAQDVAQGRDSKLTQRAIELQQNYDSAEAERDQRRIDQLMDNANAAFIGEEYDAAEAALAEVLKARPAHVEAANLKRIASRARHDRRDAVTRQKYRTAWQDTFDELQHDLMAQTVLSGGVDVLLLLCKLEYQIHHRFQ